MQKDYTDDRDIEDVAKWKNYSEIEWRIPKLTIGPSESGNHKKVYIIGGIHGDEINGVITSLRLFDILKDHKLKTEFIILPCLNPIGMNIGTRNFPYENIDLNRIILESQRDQEGGFLAKIVNKLVEIIEDGNTELIIDLHAGNKWISYFPQIILPEEAIIDYYSETGERKNFIEDLITTAIKVPLPYVIFENFSNSATRFSLIFQAYKERKKSILIEYGTGHRLNYFFCSLIITALMKFFGKMGYLELDKEIVKKVISDAFISKENIFDKQKEELLCLLNLEDNNIPNILVNLLNPDIEMKGTIAINDIEKENKIYPGFYLNEFNSSPGLFSSFKNVGDEVNIDERIGLLGQINFDNKGEFEEGPLELTPINLDHMFNVLELAEFRLIRLREDPLAHYGNLLYRIAILPHIPKGKTEGTENSYTIFRNSVKKYIAEKYIKSTNKPHKEEKSSAQETGVSLNLDLKLPLIGEYKSLKCEILPKKYNIANIKGKKIIIIVTGIHGNEYNGPYICSRLIEEIKGKNINENFVLIIFPSINSFGLDISYRNNPFDGYDINRMFISTLSKEEPVLPSVKIMKALINILESLKENNEIIGVIDIHSSSFLVKENLQIRVLFPNKEILRGTDKDKAINVFEESLKFAKYFSDWPIWIRSSDEDAFFDMEEPSIPELTFVYYANYRLEIPAVVLILGEANLLDREKSNEAKENILNVIKVINNDSSSHINYSNEQRVCVSESLQNLEIIKDKKYFIVKTIRLIPKKDNKDLKGMFIWQEDSDNSIGEIVTPEGKSIKINNENFNIEKDLFEEVKKALKNKKWLSKRLFPIVKNGSFLYRIYYSKSDVNM